MVFLGVFRLLLSQISTMSVISWLDATWTWNIFNHIEFEWFFPCFVQHFMLQLLQICRLFIGRKKNPPENGNWFNGMRKRAWELGKEKSRNLMLLFVWWNRASVAIAHHLIKHIARHKSNSMVDRLHFFSFFPSTLTFSVSIHSDTFARFCVHSTLLEITRERKMTE